MRVIILPGAKMKKIKKCVGTFLIAFIILTSSGCVENEALNAWNNQIEIANDYALQGVDYITQGENKIANEDYKESFSLLESAIEQLNLSVSAGEKALEYSGDTGMDFLTEYTNEYIDNKKELKEYTENLKNYAMVMILIKTGESFDFAFPATLNFIVIAENTEEDSDTLLLYQRAKDNIPKIKGYLQTLITYGNILELDIYVEFIGKLSSLIDILEKICDEGIEKTKASMNNNQEEIDIHSSAYENFFNDFDQILNNILEIRTQNQDLQREVGEDAFRILTNLRDQYKSAYEEHLNKAIEHKNKMEEIENAHPDELKQKE